MPYLICISREAKCRKYDIMLPFFFCCFMCCLLYNLYIRQPNQLILRKSNKKHSFKTPFLVKFFFDFILGFFESNLMNNSCEQLFVDRC